MSALDSPGLSLRLKELDDAYAAGLTPHNGFLPPLIPGLAPPPEFAPLIEACRELPERYHGEGLSVRGWLDKEFGPENPRLRRILPQLQREQWDELMLVVSILCHAYRWDSAPPRAENYQVESITLPLGLAQIWGDLAKLLDQIRVGVLYHMVLCNWTLAGREGGDSYRAAEIQGGVLDVLHPWLRGEDRNQLRYFLMTAIETEAFGAAVVESAVRLIGTAARRDAHEFGWVMDQMHGQLLEMTRPFKLFIRNRTISPDGFMTLIQPTTIWGLDEGDGILEGASGPQVGSFQVVDAVLNLARDSEMGQAILHSRSYMPKKQQHFLHKLEAISPIVQEFVKELSDPNITEIFNESVRAMLSWRRLHRMRAAHYLEGGDADLYQSTGNIVAIDEDRVSRFHKAMLGRVKETEEVLQPEAVQVSVEEAFAYLEQDELSRLLAGARPTTFQAGDTILKAGERRAAIYVLKAGMVRVVGGVWRPGGVPSVLAHLGEGAVFGEISFLDNTAATATVQAQSECVADVIDRDHVFELLNEDGFARRFFHSLASLLSGRLVRSSARLQKLMDTNLAGLPRMRRARTGNLNGIPDDLTEQLDEFECLVATAMTAPQDERRQRTFEACDWLQAILAACAAAGDDADGWYDHVFRQSFALLNSSRIADAIFSRPRGVPGGFEVLAAAHFNQPAGDPPLGEHVDAWLLQQPTLLGLGAIPNLIVDNLRDERARKGFALEVTSLGFGPAIELLAFAEEDPDGLVGTGVDRDSAACKRAAKLARGNAQAKLRFLRDDFVQLARARGRINLRGQDVIYIPYAIHWLADAEVIELLEWSHQHVIDGGVIGACVLAPGASDQLLFDHLLEWRLQAKSEEELRQLVEQTTLQSLPVDVKQCGCVNVLTIRPTGRSSEMHRQG